MLPCIAPFPQSSNREAQNSAFQFSFLVHFEGLYGGSSPVARWTVLAEMWLWEPERLVAWIRFQTICCAAALYFLMWVDWRHIGRNEYEYADRLVAWIQFKTICCAAALYFLIWADRRHIGRKEFEYALLLTVSRLDLWGPPFCFLSGPKCGLWRNWDVAAAFTSYISPEHMFAVPWLNLLQHFG